MTRTDLDAGQSDPEQDLSRQLQVQYLLLQRTLVLLALEAHRKIDGLRGKHHHSISAHLLTPAPRAELEERLKFLKESRERPLVRVAIWLHHRLDRMTGIKNALFTAMLWAKAMRTLLHRGQRHPEYQQWLKQHEAAISLEPLPKANPNACLIIWLQPMTKDTDKRKALLRSSLEFASLFAKVIVAGTFPELDDVLGDQASSYERWNCADDTELLDKLKKLSCREIILLSSTGEFRRVGFEKLFTALSENPQTQIAYADFDEIDARDRRQNPSFLPDWSWDYCVARNLFSPLVAFKQSLITQGDSQSIWARLLIATAKFKESEVLHISELAFSRTPHKIANEDLQAWTKVVGEAAKSVAEQSRVTSGLQALPRVLWPLPESLPKISLLIPTRDRIDLLRPLMDGLLNKTDYENLEVIIIDNQSREPESAQYFSEIQKDPRVRVLAYDHPFNYSAINNFGFAASQGAMIGLLNNDLLIRQPNWLHEMARELSRDEVGAVGAKLLYKNRFIQHAGVVLGIGQVASHIHRLEPHWSRGYCDRLIFPQEFSAVTAACLLVRREVYSEVKGLDEVNLAIAYNDVDFCLRIREAGWKIIWTPYAELTHLESATRPPDGRPEQLARYQNEVAYMRTRWAEWIKHDPVYNANLTRKGTNFELNP